MGKQLILKLCKGCNQLFLYKNIRVTNIMLGTSHSEKANFNRTEVAPYTAKMAEEEMETARHGGLSL